MAHGFMQLLMLHARFGHASDAMGTKRAVVFCCLAQAKGTHE